jgi:hypothetical protein
MGRGVWLCDTSDAKMVRNDSGGRSSNERKRGNPMPRPLQPRDQKGRFMKREPIQLLDPAFVAKLGRFVVQIIEPANILEPLQDPKLIDWRR